MYWSHSLRGVAMALIGVFIPIYLLELGYPLQEVVLFFALAGAVQLACLYPTMRLLAHVGGNHTMAIGTALSILHIGSLIALPIFHLPLWPLVLILGICWALYWYAARINFIMGFDAKKEGRQVGTSFALYVAAGGVAPILGGIISQLAGINVTYGVAAGLCLIALVPLLSGPEIVKRARPRISTFKWRPFLPDYLAGGCMSVDDFIQSNVWPLVIYLILPSYVGVGAVTSLTIISAVLISLYIGRREAVRGEKHYIKEGTYMLTSVGALRFLVQNSLHITGLNFLYGASRAMVDTPWYSRYYEKARASRTLEYVYFMQVFCCASFVAAGLLTYVILLFLPSLQGLLLAMLLSTPFIFGIKYIR
jgi:hypothetical protein